MQKGSENSFLLWNWVELLPHQGIYVALYSFAWESALVLTCVWKFKLNQVKIDALNSSWMLYFYEPWLVELLWESSCYMCKKHPKWYRQEPMLVNSKGVSYKVLGCFRVYCSVHTAVVFLSWGKLIFHMQWSLWGQWGENTRGKQLGVNSFPQDKAQIVLP